jgi:hypothetical protein
MSSTLKNMGENTAAEEPRKRGRPQVPEDKHRILVFMRVLPATRDFLLHAGAKNPGRAVDLVVSEYKKLRAKLKSLGKI